jgi:manganese-dependent inorganic pyrophosphatase
VGTIYVPGHRNPTTDSIASTIGSVELKGRLDPRNEYVPAGLGDLNVQSRRVLDRGAAEPTHNGAGLGVDRSMERRGPDPPSPAR